MAATDEFFDVAAVIGDVGSFYGANRRDSRARGYSYEKIPEIEMELEHIDERFRTNKVSSRKRPGTKLRRDQLKQELGELKAGHEEVARALKLQAQKLQQLQREMRIAVLEKLYVRDNAILIKSRRIGEHDVFLVPEDEPMYLSAMHVSEMIAVETAEIFYKQNIFELHPENMQRERQGAKWIDEFFDTDHYESGITPRHFIRKFEFLALSRLSHRFTRQMPSWSFEDGILPRHDRFEIEYDSCRDSNRCRHPSNDPLS